MNRDPLLVCREFLRSSSAETRSKTIAALAVNDGAGELAHLALSDPDPEVRREAERAIARLAPAARADALAQLDRALDDDRRIAAHELLTRLRGRGVTLPASRRSLLSRLDLAFSVRRARVHDGEGLWARAYPWCLGFALFAAIVMSFLVALKSEAASFTVPLVILALVLVFSPLIARTACTGAQPGDRYLDRAAGWLAEITGSGLTALPVFAIGAVLLLSIWPPIEETPGSVLMLVGLGLLGWGWVFVAAIRVATLSSAVFFSRSWWSTAVGGVAGWGAGVAAASLLLYLVLRIDETVAEVRLSTLGAAFWILAVPIAAGIAAAFARVERDAARPGKWSFRVLLALPAVLGVMLFLSSWGRWFSPRPPPSDPCPEATLAEPARCDQTFEKLPAILPLQVDFRQRVSFLKPRQGTSDLTLRLWQDERQIFPAGDQPLIEIELAEGAYLLEVVDYATAQAAAQAPRRRGLVDRFFTVAMDLSGLATEDPYGLWAREVEELEIEITLNSDPATAIAARVLELLETGRVAPAFTLFEDHPALAATPELMDQICRLASLQGLLQVQRQKPADGHQPSGHDGATLSEVCEGAILSTRGNGAVHDSRGLARLLIGDATRAREDFEIFVRWSADPYEKKQRGEWIAALSDPAVDPTTMLPAETLNELLEKSRGRDLERWTRSSAQTHLNDAVEALKKELCKPLAARSATVFRRSGALLPAAEEARASSLPEAFVAARKAFEWAATMVPALGDDPALWRYLCVRGALLERQGAAAVRRACGELSGAEAWIDELPAAELGPADLRRRQQLCRDMTPPPSVPEIDFSAVPERVSKGMS